MSRYNDNNRHNAVAQDEEIDTDMFLGGSLNTSDLERPTVVTITKAWVDVPANSAKKKVHLRFRETGKALIVNQDNMHSFREIFGTKYANRWVGGQVELYIDPTVKMGGKTVGGIRVRPVSARDSRPQDARPQVNGYDGDEYGFEPDYR